MKNKGSALIVILLILVMMTLMSFALMRSTDLATLISGNIASKQASIQASDKAFVEIEATINNLLSAISNGTGIDLATDSTANFYYAAALTDGNADGIPDDATITNPTKLSVAAETGNTGYTYQYVIERINASYNADKGTGLYRVTVRINGPKSSKSYFQGIYEF